MNKYFVKVLFSIKLSDTKHISIRLAQDNTYWLILIKRYDYRHPRVFAIQLAAPKINSGMLYLSKFHDSVRDRIGGPIVIESFMED